MPILRSEIRNRVLAPIFKGLKLIEAWGSGIQKMHDELADYPEIELRLQEVGQAFQAQFIKSKTPAGTKQGSEVQPESRRTGGRVEPESGQSHQKKGFSLSSYLGRFQRLRYQPDLG